MANLLDDYLPDAPREKLVLLAAVAAGMAESLDEHITDGFVVPRVRVAVRDRGRLRHGNVSALQYHFDIKGHADSMRIRGAVPISIPT